MDRFGANDPGGDGLVQHIWLAIEVFTLDTHYTMGAMGIRAVDFAVNYGPASGREYREYKKATF